MHEKFRAFHLLLIGLFSVLTVAGASAQSAGVALAVQERLDLLNVSMEPGSDEDLTVLSEFYAGRGYQPVWVSEAGMTMSGEILSSRLHSADTHGLVPSEYFVDRISALEGATDTAGLAELEVELSFGLLRYGQDLKHGRVAPSRVNPELFIDHGKTDRATLISAAAATTDMSGLLDDLVPHSSQYRRTVEAIAQYRKIAKNGGWEQLPDGETLKPGMTDPRVPILRRRLLAHGDLKADNATDPMFYDAELEEAMKWFQYRHGLEQDGAVGKNTRAAFNVPVEERIETMVMNLERRRWLPDDLGQQYIFVNMAGFELKLVDGDKTIFDTRVVVGTPFHRTPVFSGNMTYVVLNPYWHITPSIARNEILPSVKKDPNYLASKNIRVFSDWSANAYEVNPQTVDWSQVSPRGMSYKFRQDSGDGNALGRVKFMFPNSHSIYLHDTPSKHLFGRAKRSFSHGCIRVQNPLDMAEIVLGQMSKWTRASIDSQVASGNRKIVNLGQTIPVHLTYLTNWVNKDGSIYFREDIYGRDKLLAEALASPRV
ncbi:MAG: L,D-transpeptidase family protein [Alphaproteobacteria bacterium]|nr:L,D-transpeptidase family protein [Alphaproteobacteria bacterium]